MSDWKLCGVRIFMGVAAAEAAADEPAEKVCRYAQCKPQSRERKAYLSEKIQRHIGVIPYIPVHNKVIENPYGKFECCNDKRACKTAPYQGYGASAVDGVEQCENKTACQRHSPVSKATTDNFNQTVNKKAHKKGECEF